MNRVLEGLSSWLGSRSKAQLARQRLANAVRPVAAAAALEGLESRTLMSLTSFHPAPPAPALSGTTLNVAGSAWDDSLQIGTDTTNVLVNVNGRAYAFSKASVGSLSIYGGSGNDTIKIASNVNIAAKIDGGDGNDLITGGFGNDVIHGGTGNDTLDGGMGADDLWGDAGWDDVTYSSRAAGVNVSIDNVANDGDTISNKLIIINGQIYQQKGTEGDNVHTDVEAIWGGAGRDVIRGSGTDNYLFGLGGNGAIYGGGGNDVIFGWTGLDLLQGESGNDTLYGEGDNDTLNGGTGADFLSGGGGTGDLVTYSDRVYAVTVTLDQVANDGEAGERDNVQLDIENITGGSGNDILNGSSAANLINGMGGADLIHGWGGNDSLYGGAGNDVLNGDEGNDVLVGDADADVMSGGGGTGDMVDYRSRATKVSIKEDGIANDGTADEGDNVLADIEIIHGGLGNDSLEGSGADNIIFGEGGNDTIRGWGGNDVLYGGTGNDSLEGSGADNIFFGEGGNDTIRGWGGNDVLYGGTGDDDLYGGAGTDRLEGAAGRDGLFGGADADTLSGGTESDRFIQTFAVGATIGDDRILDAVGEDALCSFRNSPAVTNKSFAGQKGTYDYAAGAWSDTEIEVMDSALAVLHHATQNDNLLERPDGTAMSYWRVGAKTNSTGGSFSAGAWNQNDGQIYFVNVNRQTLLHETGHDWDEEYNAAGWQSQSGWTTSDKSSNPLYVKGGDAKTNWYHLASAQFVSNYAMTNPHEDFAESFSAFMMNRGGWAFSGTGTPITAIAGKSQFITGLITSLS